jgi:hypothetical protein
VPDEPLAVSPVVLPVVELLEPPLRPDVELAPLLPVVEPLAPLLRPDVELAPPVPLPLPDVEPALLPVVDPPLLPPSVSDCRSDALPPAAELGLDDDEDEPLPEPWAYTGSATIAPSASADSETPLRNRIIENSVCSTCSVAADRALPGAMSMPRRRCEACALVDTCAATRQRGNATAVCKCVPSIAPQRSAAWHGACSTLTT